MISVVSTQCICGLVHVDDHEFCSDNVWCKSIVKWMLEQNPRSATWASLHIIHIVMSICGTTTTGKRILNPQWIDFTSKKSHQPSRILIHYRRVAYMYTTGEFRVFRGINYTMIHRLDWLHKFYIGQNTGLRPPPLEISIFALQAVQNCRNFGLGAACSSWCEIDRSDSRSGHLLKHMERSDGGVRWMISPDATFGKENYDVGPGQICWTHRDLTLGFVINLLHHNCI